MYTWQSLLETSINLRQCLTIGTGKRIDLRPKTFTFCKKKKNVDWKGGGILSLPWTLDLRECI